jgi:BetI-type transcriptional repressor, C-terminal
VRRAHLLRHPPRRRPRPRRGKASHRHRDAQRAVILAWLKTVIIGVGCSTGSSTQNISMYFMEAAVTASSTEIGAAVAPILASPKSRLPYQLVEELLAGWVSYARSGVGAADGIDRMPVALHGWSYAQTDPELKATLQASLRAFRELRVPIIKQWQTDGTVDADVEPDAVAQLILSISLGFVAQRALTGDAEVQAHADALAALTTARPTISG